MYLRIYIISVYVTLLPEYVNLCVRVYCLPVYMSVLKNACVYDVIYMAYVSDTFVSMHACV